MAGAKPLTVLVVSETLSRGGLETRLLTQGTALTGRGHRMLYATGSPEVPAPFSELAVHTFPNLGLGLGASARACADAADELARIIRDHQVDVVHAHPFASLVGAGMAAALTGTPLTVTAHGPTSFTGPPNLDTALFDLVLPYASSIRVVSEELKALLPTTLWPRLHVLPNAVDLSRFTPLKKLPPRGPWAFLGRLDDGKSRAAAQLIDWAPVLGLEAVHVIGSGSESPELQQRAERAGVRVEFLGWRDDVAELLREGYAGVAGMGRVVLEAAALGLPCILAGYEQLHGLVTPERFPEIAFTNFSGRGVPVVADAEALAAELRTYGPATRAALRHLVESAHDEAQLVRKNERLLTEARVVESERAGLLQLHGLFRRTTHGETAWALDHELAVGLERLARRPGRPPMTRVVTQAAALIDENTRRAVAQEHQALAAQVAALQANVAALGAQLDIIAQKQDQTLAHLAWRLARAAAPEPLRRTARPLTERLRRLLKP